MDIAAMHKAVDLGLQRIASHVFDNFLTEEIDQYLNNAILKYVEGQRDIIITTQSGVLPSVKATENIRTLINTHVFSSTTGKTDLPNSFVVSLASLDPSFGYYLHSRTQLENGWRNNTLVSIDELFEYAETEKNRPIFRVLPVSLESTNLLGIVDSSGQDIEKVFLTYAKYPATVLLDVDGEGADNVDCDLPVHTHQEIVDITIAIMIQDLLKTTKQP